MAGHIHSWDWTEHTKSRLRKSWTSSVVDGPPMFMKTIAVGPFEPAEFCVTGGVCTVARHLAVVWVALFETRSGDAPELIRGIRKLLESCVADCRRAMATVCRRCLL